MELQVGDKIKVSVGNWSNIITVKRVTKTKAIAEHLEKGFRYVVTTEFKREYDSPYHIKRWGDQKTFKWDLTSYELVTD